MSKYTTEVRFICENSAGLSESEGADNVDSILDRSWYRDWETDRKSTRLNSSHSGESRMPSSA